MITALINIAYILYRSFIILIHVFRFVVENPLGVIKSAKDVTDFSGLTPTGYSFEDLHAKFDENTSVSKEQKNWTFSSSTFMHRLGTGLPRRTSQRWQ